jgi:hypothetical protein
MANLKLYMVLLGCTPPGRNTEQHDVFFGVGEELRDLVEDFRRFWPEAEEGLHIDAWKEISGSDGYRVEIVPRQSAAEKGVRLFFINLGGYKPGDFEEYHYKLVFAAEDKGLAIQLAKQSAFYLHAGFKGAESHVDDKFGVDVDDCYEITDILPDSVKSKYSIVLHPDGSGEPDHLHIGYVKLGKLFKESLG